MDVRLETLMKLGYSEDQIRKMSMHSKLYQLKFDIRSDISDAISELKDKNYNRALVVLSNIIKQLASDEMRDVVEEISTDKKFIDSYEYFINKVFGTDGLMMRCTHGPSVPSDLNEVFDEVITTIRHDTSYTNVRNELLSDLDYSEKLVRVSRYIRSFNDTVYLNYNANNIALHYKEIVAVSGMYIISFLYDVIDIIESRSNTIINEIKNNKKEESTENGEAE